MARRVAQPINSLLALLEEKDRQLGVRFSNEHYWAKGGTAEDTPRNRRLLNAGLDDCASTALCLSGGGIRSATFGLGVLQALAQRRWLRSFDYLSTVSGGGFIGAWLSRWLNEAGIDAVEESLQPGRTEEPERIRRLRAYSSYLAPRRGLSRDTFTIVAIYMRNLAINWAILIPLLVAVLAVPRIAIAAALWLSAHADLAGLPIVAAVALLGVIAWYVASRSPIGDAPAAAPSAFVSGIGVLAVGLLWSITLYAAPVQSWPRGLFLFGLLTSLALSIGRFAAGGSLPAAAKGASVYFATGLVSTGIAMPLVALSLALHGNPLVYMSLAPFLLTTSLWFASVLGVAIVSPFLGESSREWWGSFTAGAIRAVLYWTAGALLVLVGPSWLLSGVGVAAGFIAAAGLAGVLSTLVGFFGASGVEDGGPRDGLSLWFQRRVLPLVASAFAISFVALISLATSRLIDRAPWEANDETMQVAKELSARASKMERLREAVREKLGGGTGQEAFDQAEIGEKRSLVAQAIQRLAEADVDELVAGWRARHEEVTGRDVPARALGFLVIVGSSIAILVSWLAGANRFSLHAAYGNRLVRAYVGKSTAQGAGIFDPEDNLSESALVGLRPLPVVNLALNVTRGGPLEWQSRKATTFSVTPYFCGSPATGFVPTEAFAGEKGMSVGKAMTISGAAASPAMGYHTSKAVAFAMTLLNVRLGWWLPNPRSNTELARKEPRFPLRALARELLGIASLDDDWIYASDGGHFDNLGLYEMVRRRCRRIVVVDASADPKFQYDDLARTLRLVRADFGVDVEFDKRCAPRRGAAPAQQVMLGRIRYWPDGTDDDRDGTLVYIKPMLPADAPIDVIQHAEPERAARFPHATTSDQFFDEAQFESYRRLGLLTARELEALGDLDTLLPPARCVPSGGFEARADAPAARPRLASLVETLGSPATLIPAAVSTATAVTVALTVSGSIPLVFGSAPDMKVNVDVNASKSLELTVPEETKEFVARGIRVREPKTPLEVAVNPSTLQLVGGPFQLEDKALRLEPTTLPIHVDPDEDKLQIELPEGCVQNGQVVCRIQLDGTGKLTAGVDPDDMKKLEDVIESAGQTVREAVDRLDTASGASGRP